MENRSLPPPGHPIYDVLQLSGQIRSTPTKIEKAKQRLNFLSDDEAATIARRDQGFQLTPLEGLDWEVKKFFDKGPLDASIKFHALQCAVLEGTTVVDIYRAQDLPPIFAQAIPWNSCKLATTLVLLFACPSDSDSIFEALKFQSRSLNGLPTMADIISNPSADLPKRFARAKKAAIDGKIGETTVLGVSLVDVEMIERAERGSSDMRYSSFAHSFVLAIGREGFRVFQAWGEHGYRLDQYLMGGGSRLRDWEDAKKFLKLFSKLTCPQVYNPGTLLELLDDSILTQQ
ncbi:hypothetical protein N7471_010623 [Penicillium samsonianum]|uniref:uncharacterized protein n=1 Tax=Penicillium samsonianum TaxID=1882272 RepID=UPI0025479AC9|nr:uncharacterized protein N7471_010623 [Penicillium samsonianum]KAJ6126130.1 hypothetical protein N7471_010623 [Penicillium samsonianum]